VSDGVERAGPEYISQRSVGVYKKVHQYRAIKRRLLRGYRALEPRKLYNADRRLLARLESEVENIANIIIPDHVRIWQHAEWMPMACLPALDFSADVTAGIVPMPEPAVSRAPSFSKSLPALISPLIEPEDDDPANDGFGGRPHVTWGWPGSS